MDGTEPAPVWTATWRTGPDAGRVTALAPGRHVLGSGRRCTLHADDPSLEAHHLAIDVGSTADDRPATVHRLAGVCGDAPLAGHPGGLRLRVGSSEVDVCRAEPARPAAAPANVRRGVVLRVPRPPLPPAAEAVAVPAAAPVQTRHTSGLLPAMLALAAAGVVAGVTRQPMFVLFGAMGAGVAMVSWIVQRTGEARRDRRDGSAHLRSLDDYHAGLTAAHDAQIAVHLSRTTNLHRAVAAISGPTSELWQRRAGESDARRVALGFGPVAFEAPLAGDPPPGDLAHTTVVDDLPVAVTLDAGTRLVVRGPAHHADSVARSVLVQLMAACGPADLRVVVVTEQATRWEPLASAPHLHGPGGAMICAPPALADTLAALAEDRSAHLLLVTDQPELLASRTSPLRRALAAIDGASLMVVAGEADGIPQLCTASLDVSRSMTGQWTPSLDDALAHPVRLAGLGGVHAAQLCDRLAALTDPDDPFTAGARLPNAVTLGALHRAAGLDPTDATAVAAGWVAGGHDPALRTPIGIAGDGTVDVDLVADGPHALIAGTTGAGKSELLRSLVVGWATANSPEHLAFVLVDYKGGATFDVCLPLPHVTGVITDLDGRLADRALRSLHAELRRREAILRHHGAVDLADLRARTASARLPRLVVIVDEFAALVAERPDFLTALVGIAQRGRSLGVHLLLATQRPHGVISDDVRANTTLRIALRVLDREDALDAIGDATPSTFSRSTPGRAMIRLGPDEHLVFQAAHGAPGEHEATVAAIRGAAGLLGMAAPPAPWLPPLPEQLDPHDDTQLNPQPDTHLDTHQRLAAHRCGDRDPGDLGLVDDPDGQRQFALRWSESDGSLLVAGRRGMGVTTALRTVTGRLLDDPAIRNVTVIDAVGARAWEPVEAHPAVCGVVRADDGELARQAIERLARIVTERRARGGWQPDERREALVIDGLDTLRTVLDDPATADLFDALTTVITTGAAAGVTIVAGVERAGALPPAVIAGFPQRWVLHLADPHDGYGLGVAAADLPGPVPGRIVLAASGLHAQVRQPAPLPAPSPDCAARPVPHAPRLARLPAFVTTAQLRAPSAHPAGAAGRARLTLPIGLRPAGAGESHVDSSHAPFAECDLTVHDGAHVLILGAPRTGRSTALATIVWQWRRACPDGWSAGVRPRDGDRLADALDALPSGGQRLVAIDDAELVDDGGALAVLLAGHQPGLLVVAAASADALRRTYGHWTGAMRAGRLGLVGTASAEHDGDLLSATLPRRAPVAARQGLMWLVDNGRETLVHVAIDLGCRHGGEVPP